VDRDDFIPFQHDHPVHQHFPNVQGSETLILRLTVGVHSWYRW
jgi:hypothetical protein